MLYILTQKAYVRSLRVCKHRSDSQESDALHLTHARYPAPVSAVCAGCRSSPASGRAASPQLRRPPSLRLRWSPISQHPHTRHSTSCKDGIRHPVADPPLLWVRGSAASFPNRAPPPRLRAQRSLGPPVRAGTGPSTTTRSRFVDVMTQCLKSAHSSLVCLGTLCLVCPWSHVRHRRSSRAKLRLSSSFSPV